MILEEGALYFQTYGQVMSVIKCISVLKDGHYFLEVVGCNIKRYIGVDGVYRPDECSDMVSLTPLLEALL